MEAGSPFGHSRNSGPVAPSWIPLVLRADFESFKARGRRPTSKEIRDLICQRMAENPNWGAPRSHASWIRKGNTKWQNSIHPFWSDNVTAATGRGCTIVTFGLLDYPDCDLGPRARKR